MPPPPPHPPSAELSVWVGKARGDGRVVYARVPLLATALVDDLTRAATAALFPGTPPVDVDLLLVPHEGERKPTAEAEARATLLDEPAQPLSDAGVRTCSWLLARAVTAATPATDEIMRTFAAMTLAVNEQREAAARVAAEQARAAEEQREAAARVAAELARAAEEQRKAAARATEEQARSAAEQRLLAARLLSLTADLGPRTAATPTSSAQLAHTVLDALARMPAGSVTVLAPVDGGTPVLQPAQQAALQATAATAGEVGLVRFMTPHLSQLCLPVEATRDADPCRPLLVNSERLQWLVPAATPTHSELRQKPDLFRSWAPFVDLRAAGAGQGDGPEYVFGVLAGLLLQRARCAVALFEAKRGSLTEAHFGELCAYHQAIPGLCRGMLFGETEFRLYESMCGWPLRLVKGLWVTAGAAGAIRDFFDEAALEPPPLVALLRRLLGDLRVAPHHGADGRCFLGSGASGHVFAVMAQGGAAGGADNNAMSHPRALKVVLARTNSAVIAVDDEFRRLRTAAERGAPVVAPVPGSLHLYGVSEDGEELGAGFGGAGYLLERVGAPFEVTSEARCKAAFESLAALHRCGLIHGDARLPNLLAMEDGRLAWIDLNHAGAMLEGGPGAGGAAGGLSRDVVAFDAGDLARTILHTALPTLLPDAVARALASYTPDCTSSIASLASTVWRAAAHGYARGVDERGLQ